MEFNDRLAEVIREQVSPDKAGTTGGRLVSTLLRPDLPPEERGSHIKEALDGAQRSVLNGFKNSGLVNPETIESEAFELSQNLISGIVDIAMGSKKKSDNRSGGIVMEALNPQKKTIEDRVKSAIIVTDIMRPFLIKRLLDLDIYQTQDVKEKLGSLVQDLRLLVNFYDSIKYVVEFTQEEKLSIDQKDLSNRLFKIGPIFAKLLQTFASSKSISSEKGSILAKNLQDVFQEGVAPPTENDISLISRQIPSGLVIEAPINSASVAFILRTRDNNGQKYATKVSRPGIEEAKEQNIRVFSVITETLVSFIQEHAGNTSLAARLKTIQKVLPFFLKVAEKDIDQELDFNKQITAQNYANKIFQKHKGIIVPEVIDTFSDDRNITMQIELAEKIQNLPANKKLLENIFTFCVESFRSRFWHADLHAGNLKGRKDGSIVVYDWGQNFRIPDRFLRNIGTYLFALARRDPKGIAKAYCKIQDINETILNQETVSKLVQEIFDEQSQSQTKNKRGRMHQIILTQEQMILALAVRHQSAVDPRYLAFMKSGIALSSIVKSELAKPEYGNKRSVKIKEVASAFWRGIKNSYFG